VSEHEAKAVKMSHAWVAECSCGWLGADQTIEANAAEDAADHERDPSQLELIPWSPEQHPFKGV
jgi:hypothetical protein